MNTPNKITCVRLAMAVLLLAIYSLSFIPSSATWAPNFVIAGFNLGFTWIDLVCFVLFIIGSVTDAVDGHIARSRNLITDLGKFLDPLADKFLVDSALILLATKTDWSGNYQVLPLFVILFIGRDMAMDGLRMIASTKGKVLAANKWGKVKTAIQMGLIPILFLNGFPFSLIPTKLDMNYWMTNRFDYTYLITNFLIAIALFFSIMSLVIYLKQNNDVLKEGK